MSAGDTLYLKIGKNVVVTDRRVTLGDVAKMECTDQAALRQIRQKKLYSFRAEDDKKKKNTLVVFSVLKVIELIHEDYPNLDISNEGECFCKVLSADHGNGIEWHHRTGNLLQYWTCCWDYCVFQPCGTQENHA